MTDWRLNYGSRPEHIFIGPRWGGQGEIVAALREAGHWAHEQTTESGDEIIRIYAAQKKLYDAAPSALTQPRMFFTDTQWWLYGARFHYVNPHLVAQFSYPERELEAVLPDRDLDWLYRWGSDARERLLPDLIKAISGYEAEAGTVQMAARIKGAEYFERVYPELVPVLTWCIPHQPRFASQAAPLRMARLTFESRVRSFRQKYELPDKLTAATLVEYLIALGICEYSHQYYVRFPPAFAVGLQELKNILTREAIAARLAKKG